MKTIKYTFCDRTEVKVEVSDTEYEKVHNVEKEARHSDMRAYRHQTSLNYINEELLEVILAGDNLETELDKAEDTKNLYTAISKLLKEQQELIKKIFYGNKTITEIAKELGVDKSAISHRLERIYKKLKGFLS
jgi:RNA polymerase sigma-70 factor (ECF subfamily)